MAYGLPAPLRPCWERHGAFGLALQSVGPTQKPGMPEQCSATPEARARLHNINLQLGAGGWAAAACVWCVAVGFVGVWDDGPTAALAVDVLGLAALVAAARSVQRAVQQRGDRLDEVEDFIR